MAVRSQFKLSSGTLKAIYDVCEQFEVIWKNYDSAKSPPSFCNLIKSFCPETQDELSQVRRELINSDLRYRWLNGIPISNRLR
ncbi:hypothetical protein N9Y42_06735 [Mariniblastus sp.]|nr:hypothetical protein [Mariniblastus sp.]